MNGWEALAVFVSGIWAGAINTVVGSGTLVSFPVLLAIGLPPVAANVTNTIGLVFGSVTGAIGYRAELSGQRRLLLRLVPACLAGAVIGAILLLTLPASAFKAIVPVLIGIALVLVLVQPRLAAYLAGRTDGDEPRLSVTPALWIGVFLTGIYGGYFGAAQGILLLALLGVLLDENLQRINATKNVLAAIVNGIAAVVFVFTAPIHWAAAGLVAAGAVVGGVVGARVGRRLSPMVLRAIIVVVGVAAIVKLLT